MIQANDLRIGNYVEDEDGVMVKVLGLDSQRQFNHQGTLYVGTAQCYYKKYRGSMGKWIQMLNPIPLTEEILLKCGFVKLDKGDYFFIHEDQLNFKVSGDLSLVAWHNLAIHDACIKHLHQLQNLYFALTGKELEVML